MKNGNGKIGTCSTFAVVVRGGLEHIDALIDFLKASDLVIAHQEIEQQKM